MATQTEQLLDLDVLVERPRIRLNKVEYQLKHPDELSLVEYHLLGNKWKQFRAIVEKSEDETSEADLNKAEQLVDEITRRVVMDAPEDVLAALTHSQRMKIGTFFTRRLLQEVPVAPAAVAAEGVAAPPASSATPTGEK